MLTYNQEQFVADALNSVLTQQCEPVEIVVSDDCSTDNTFSIMEEILTSYDGPHQVKLHRNERNLGLAGNFDKVHELSGGEIIVAAAGDDVSHPNRVQEVLRAFEEEDASLVCSHVTLIGFDGAELEMDIDQPTFHGEWTLENAARSTALYYGATGAWKRRLYFDYGPISPKCYEDLVLGFRAALEDGVTLLETPLVSYRVGHGITSANILDDDPTADVAFQKKSVEVFDAVFEQRMQDALRFGLPPTSRIHQVLRDAAENNQIELIRVLYRGGETQELRKLARSRPFRVLRTVFSERGRVRRRKRKSQS